jgi:small subunit ribosomal protein S21
MQKMRTLNDGPRGLSVEVRNGDINSALRKFKKKVQDSGLLQELRDREFYEKPTTKRKREKAQAISRGKKKVKQQEEQLGIAQPTKRK